MEVICGKDRLFLYLCEVMTLMKRAYRLVLVLLAVLSLAGCASVKDIAVTSCSVVSVSPQGLRSADAVLALGIKNPLMAFTIKGLDGTIHKGDQTFATFSTSSLAVDRKCTKVYLMDCTGSLDKSVSLRDLLKIAASRDFEGYAIDLTMNVRLRWGIGKTLHFNNLMITDLMSADVAAAYLKEITDCLI